MLKGRAPVVSLLILYKPDFVHVMQDGEIIKTGGPELALELEETGYVAA
jgi:Fe-S cluster assembly ATP-binding protein